jgi:membrane protein
MDIEHIKTVLTKFIWGDQVESLPWWKRWLIIALRVSCAIVRDLLEGQLTLRATSLVYTTLLSLVPVLAISLAVLKGLGVHNQIEPLMLDFLKPLGERGMEIHSRIIGFVDNTKAGVLGSVGLVVLLLTVVTLMQQIEAAFNYIWNVKRSRTLGQSLSHFLSFILVSPIFVVTTLGIMASVMSTAVVQKLTAIGPVGALFALTSQFLPQLMLVVAFMFFYMFIPNTKVHFKSALIGAVVAGILWAAAGWAFAAFVVNSTKYMAIYSGLAILVIFMLWVYAIWVILLVGADIAFYQQHPEFLTPRQRRVRLSIRVREKLSLLVMVLIGQNFYRHLPAWTMEGLTQRLRVPRQALEPILEALVQQGLLSRACDQQPSYLPARPLDTTELAEVLAAVRTAPDDASYDAQSPLSELTVDQVLSHLEEAMRERLRGSTVKELALSESLDVS